MVIGCEGVLIDPRPPEFVRRTALAGKLHGYATDLARASGTSLGTRFASGGVETELRVIAPDLVISVEANLARGEAARWSDAARAPTVLWYPDHLLNLVGQRVFSAGFDASFFKDRLIVERLRALSARDDVWFLPEGCRSKVPDDWLAPATEQELEEFEDTVVVAGNLYPTRVSLLERVLPSCRLRLYGDVPRSLPAELRAIHSGRYLAGRDKFRAFRFARAVLNNMHFGEFGGVNFRLFEAAFAGARILTDDLPQVGQYFEPGREVLVYQSIDELIALLQSDLVGSYPDLGAAARARALADHRMSSRLTMMLEILRLAPES